MKEKNYKVAATETSADGLAWEKQDSINIAGLLENLEHGERVFIRSTVSEVYPSGRTSLPKSGAIYELVAKKMELPRLVLAEKEPLQIEKENL